MIKAITLAIMVAAIATPAFAQGAKVIRNNGGGNVNAFMANVRTSEIFGQTVKIDGWCASACALYLASPYTCVTRRAKVAFHAPRGGTRSQNESAALFYANTLPNVLGAWFLENAAHLTGDKFKALSGAQLVRMGAAKYCK